MLDEGSKETGVLNDGSFACMCWEGARGNNKIEVTVGKGDN